MRPSEILRKGVLGRFESELTAVLRRKQPAEAKLAGVLRALCPLSLAARNMSSEAGEVLVRRGSFDRELYMSAVRALADAKDKRAAPLIRAALQSDDGGGLATLSAACFCPEQVLAEPLTRIAAGRNAELAFGAEVARLVRGESDGGRLVELAPRIKESSRIALCCRLFVPLMRGPALPPSIGPSLAVLRDAERHLGRWLVLADVATHALDPAPLHEARRKSQAGAMSARAAWSLVAWALEPGASPPATRPTLELVARLSERPTADRDTTFLFRLANAGASSARPVLETLTKATPLSSETALRAAMHLARDHGQNRMRAAIVEYATGKREDGRGVAAAALWDLHEPNLALAAAEQAEGSRALSSIAWGSLVRAACEGRFTPELLLDDPTFRRVEYGWVE
jgi:hypothetical protein